MDILSKSTVTNPPYPSFVKGGDLPGKPGFFAAIFFTAYS